MKVSVAMITYNHEEFIAKAIDSILMQRTDFDFEIVIGEDCSTDNTRNILIDYQKRFPDKFKLLLNEKNLGAHRNATQTFESSKGKYVAVLEGDDYWTSPYKLQKQVDFLDDHPECVICFHNALMVYEDTSLEPDIYCPPDQKEFSTIEDLLRKGNFLPTCSKMYRRALLHKIPEWVFTLKMGDWPIDILNARYGKIGYINEIMGVYMIHRGGAWFNIRQDWEETNKANIEVYETLYKSLEFKYRKIIRSVLHDLYVESAVKYEEMGNVGKARDCVIRSFMPHFKISGKSLKMMLKLYVPALFKLLKSVKCSTYS